MRGVRRGRSTSVLVAGVLLAAALAGCVPQHPAPEAHPTSSRHRSPSPTATATPTAPLVASPPPAAATSPYPWHHGIVSTTFWVGEIFDPSAADGSQVISTYDSDWLGSFGGCDGVARSGSCETEARSPANGWFPTSMTPRQNPFYLDLPYDDINDPSGFAQRGAVIPWAHTPPYSAHAGDDGFSYLKNRWVELQRNGRTCYGQIEDAGPGEYQDATYVFGASDARPANKRYGGAGMDVSPALTGCLAFPELDGTSGVVDWRFVEAGQVPAGPWTRLVTTTGVR